MAHFALMCFDKPNSLALRMATREAHFAYGRSTPGLVRLGGPFLNDAGEMIGSLIIIEVADLAAAWAWHEADPYKRAGLFERVDLQPWKATFGELP
jgi:uncharacterized protein